MSVGIINKQIEERASLQKNFLKTANMLFGKEWNELTKEELYQTLVRTIRQYISENWIMTNKYYEENKCKEVYYLSLIRSSAASDVYKRQMQRSVLFFH